MDRLCPTVPSRLIFLQWVIGVTNIDTRKPSRWLDVGTGCAPIFPLLLTQLLTKKIQIVATDIQSSAIECARENLARNNLNQQVDLVLVAESDPLVPPAFSSDTPTIPSVVICNPPFFDNDNDQTVVMKATPPSSTSSANKLEHSTRGGEMAFVKRLYNDSLHTKGVWFSVWMGVRADMFAFMDEIKGECTVHHKTLRLGQTSRYAIAWIIH